MFDSVGLRLPKSKKRKKKNKNKKRFFSTRVDNNSFLLIYCPANIFFKFLN